MKVLKNGSEFDVISNVDIIEKLPIGNYELRFGAFGRMYFNLIEDIILPEKVYSNDTVFIEHVMKSWEDSKGSVGIGLVGGKGLGKSFTGNIIAKKANVPIIRIMGPVNNPGIFELFNKIEQDFVLYIDEFEKIFNTRRDKEHGGVSQEEFLTFLDNGSERPNKIMFIITANSHHSINDFLKNRPSRLRYYKSYDRLEDRLIREIVEDLLINKENQSDLLRHLPYEDLNMDVLIQIINEMNIHNTSYSVFKDFFNYSRVTPLTYKTYRKEEGKTEFELITAKIRGTDVMCEGDGIYPTGEPAMYLCEDVDFNDLQADYAAYSDVYTDKEHKKVDYKVKFVPVIAEVTYAY